MRPQTGSFTRHRQNDFHFSSCAMVLVRLGGFSIAYSNRGASMPVVNNNRIFMTGQASGGLSKELK
jgi:hypothetical protein